MVVCRSGGDGDFLRLWRFLVVAIFSGGLWWW